jgi:hypothetical protein
MLAAVFDIIENGAPQNARIEIPPVFVSRG